MTPMVWMAWFAFTTPKFSAGYLFRDFHLFILLTALDVCVQFSRTMLLARLCQIAYVGADFKAPMAFKNKHNIVKAIVYSMLFVMIVSSAITAD